MRCNRLIGADCDRIISTIKNIVSEEVDFRYVCLKSKSWWRSNMRSLEEKIKSLPIDLRKEVEDFIDFLIERKMKKGVKKPMFTWEGALKELKDQYNSVELQHEISKWRIRED